MHLWVYYRFYSFILIVWLHSFYLLYLANKTIDKDNKMQFLMAIWKCYSAVLNSNLQYSFLPLILLIQNYLNFN